MTAATLTHLPLQVGSVVLASTGRAALWIIARYMRNPLTNSAIAALVVTSAMAGSNALYGQRHAHPAPLFAAGTEQAAKVEPVVPVPRPKSLRATGASESAAKVVSTDVETEPEERAAATANDGPIGNSEVYNVQRKLEQLGMFTGTVDGYYGPQTARAIRKFEEQQGVKPVGKLSREVVEAILAAPLSGVAPKAKVVAPSAEPAAETSREVTLPAAEAAPVAEDLAPARQEAAADVMKSQTLAELPEPAPLSADLRPTSTQSAKPMALTTRPVPDSAEKAVAMAADTAGDAIDTILAGAEQALNSKSVDSIETASAPMAKPGVPLAIDEAPAAPGTPIKVLDTAATPDDLKPAFSVSDPTTVARVQRGLASLGFLHGPADGVAGEATAKAIRNFEVYFNYKVTGRISPELLGMLADSGASI
jgi:peptidoglycan hydrolase-like protein with peptidoglycan-binding domain